MYTVVHKKLPINSCPRPHRIPTDSKNSFTNRLRGKPAIVIVRYDIHNDTYVHGGTENGDTVLRIVA